MPPFTPFSDVADRWHHHFQQGWQQAHEEANAAAEKEAADIRRKMLKHELDSYKWKDTADQLHNAQQQLDLREKTRQSLATPHRLIPDLATPPDAVPGMGQATLPSADGSQTQPDASNYAMNMPPPLTHATATIPGADLTEAGLGKIPQETVQRPTPEEALTQGEMPLQPGIAALLKTAGIEVPEGTKLSPANQEKLFSAYMLAQQKADNTTPKLQPVGPGGVLVDSKGKPVYTNPNKPGKDDSDKVHVIPGFVDSDGNPIVATDAQLKEYAAGKRDKNSPLLNAHNKGSEKLDAAEKKTLDTINSTVPIMREILAKIAPGVNPDNALTDEGLQAELAKTQGLDDSISGKASALKQMGMGKIGFGYGPGWDLLIPQTEHINTLAVSPYLAGSRNYNLIQDIRKFLPAPSNTTKRQVQDMLNFINTTHKIKAGQNLGKSTLTPATSPATSEQALHPDLDALLKKYEEPTK